MCVNKQEEVIETTKKGCARSVGIHVSGFDHTANGDSDREVTNMVVVRNTHYSWYRLDGIRGGK